MRAMQYYEMNDEERLDKITTLESFCDSLEEEIKTLKTTNSKYSEYVEKQEAIIIGLNYKLQPKSCDGCISQRYYDEESTCISSTMYGKHCDDMFKLKG